MMRPAPSMPARRMVSASAMCVSAWLPHSMARRAAVTDPGKAAASASTCKSRCSSMPNTIRTLIVDEEPLAVERLQILCARIADVSLIGTAADGASALRLIKVLKPDLVLLDIQMAGINGIAVAQ